MSTIPFNIQRLEHHHYRSNRRSNVSGVLEEDGSFKWGKFHQDMTYHSNEMARPYPILDKTVQLATRNISEIRRRDLGLDIVAITIAKFKKKL